MSLSNQDRRALASQGNRLKPALALAGGVPSETAIQHVRHLLSSSRLIKVRIQTDDRTVCQEVADALVARVPCDLVRRTGFTLLLAAADQAADA